MSITTENILLIGSILLFISILAGKTSYRFGVPTLLFFLLIGMLAGSEGIGRIEFNDPGLAQFIGIVALNFILFSGGFDTDWKLVRPVLWKGLTLSTAGVLLTAAATGLFVHLIMGFPILEALLLGSIVSSTDAAAVFSILRAKNTGLKGNLRSTLELESGSNDPMAYFLTIAFIGLIINTDRSTASIIPQFLMQFSLGALFGIATGYFGRFVINRIRLDYEGLYPVLVIAIMFFSFAAADFVGGNGFLSVYITAVYLGNQDLMHKRTIIKVFDGIAWLMQIVLFLTLGLLVTPSSVLPVMGSGLLISVFLIIFARPLSVYLSLWPFRMRNRDRLFISWIGLRGAVPIVFATYPMIAGIEKAGLIFNIVFFISVTSVLIQGTSLPLVARLLKVALPEKLRRKTPLEVELSETFRSEITEIRIPEGSDVAGRKIIDLKFPRTAFIMMIKRAEGYITPNGSTELHEGDTLLILTHDEETLERVNSCLNQIGTLPSDEAPGQSDA
jgi:cell volume regulation protein A